MYVTEHSEPLSGFHILCICVIGYFVLRSLWRITFDPLVAVPGPRLCGITRIPYWYATIRGQNVFWLHKLHQEYGQVVRFGPRDVSFAGADAWRPVNGIVWNKREKARSSGVQSMLTAEYESHSKARRVFAPAFSERAARQQQPLVKKYTNLLISKLAELSANGQPVELTSLFNFTTFDIMAEMSFGCELRQLEKAEYSSWVKAIFGQLKALPVMSIIEYYPILTWLFNMFQPKAIQQMRIDHCAFSAELSDRRVREGPTYEHDLWKYATIGLTTKEMHSNAEFFMVAGSETVATLLAGAVFYLHKTPHVMKRLNKELREAFSTVEDMTFDELAQLPYLNACVKESMRIFPPVAVGSPRLVYKGGQEICGYWLPEATRISVHHYSTYHSAANFKNPEEFAPERWLNDPRYAEDIREAHQPFSSGPRDCLGRAFAKHETRMILAAVLFQFDLELCEESLDWDKRLLCYGLWDKGSMKCRLRPYRG
ncbi:cytochrome P450 [Xylariaceae sp. FL1019]|nr:cytochrome P450 [Xylariaceae sp. FL1019]